MKLLLPATPKRYRTKIETLSWKSRKRMGTEPPPLRNSRIKHLDWISCFLISQYYWGCRETRLITVTTLMALKY